MAKHEKSIITSKNSSTLSYSIINNLSEEFNLMIAHSSSSVKTKGISFREEILPKNTFMVYLGLENGMYTFRGEEELGDIICEDTYNNVWFDDFITEDSVKSLVVSYRRIFNITINHV